MPKLTKTFIDKLAVVKDTIIFDDEVSGFGIRVKPSGNKSYLIQYRNQAGQTKKLTLGKHGVLTSDQARKLAKQKLGDVAHGKDRNTEKSQQRCTDY